MSIHYDYTRYSDSATLLQRALKVIPGSTNSWTRWTDYPLSVSRAKGARLTDVDQREYLDLHGAFNAIILGHSFDAVVTAVANRIRDLVLVGIGRTHDEVELAERIVRHLPSADQVLLEPAGGNATYDAIRLARAVTRRDCIVKFAGCFHGPHDYVLRGAADDASDGVLQAAARTVITCSYNALDEVEAMFAARGEEIAAIIVEPIAYNASLHPEPDFLPGLRRIAREYGALLIFDEVITGFRVGLGGAQALYGVLPDLTALGKALGNGFQVAALAGPVTYMEHFATTPRGTVPYSGTHNGNAVAVSAANATLRVLEDEPVYDHINRLGDRMRDGLRSIVNEAGIPGVVTGHGSIYNLLFCDRRPKSFHDLRFIDQRMGLEFRNALMRRGVLWMPLASMRAQLTYSHTDKDVDHVLELARESLKAAREYARQTT